MGGGILAGCSDSGQDCKPDPDLPVPEKPVLVLIPNAPLAFDAAGGSAFVKVETDAGSWTVRCDCDWLETKRQPDGFTVTAAENRSTESRGPESITVEAGNGSDRLAAVIEASQSGTAAATLTVSPEGPLTFGPDGGSAFVTVQTNQTSWNAVPDEKWCAVEKSARGFTVTATPNELSEPRSATISITAGGGENTASASVGVEQSAAEPQAADLSAAGTANCYAVASPGLYSFDASVIGNGQSGIIPGAGFHTENASIAPDGARLVWQDYYDSDGGLIRSLSLRNGRIVFETAEGPGNAVIAATAGNDILWSWHIWVRPEIPDIRQTNHAGSTYTVMAMNLGDCPDAAGGLLSCGMLYQWGRKDPFAGPASLKSFDFRPLYDSEGARIERRADYSYEGISVGASVLNPDMFASFNESDYSWTPRQNNSLWGDPNGYEDGASRIKTVYDPCPFGYTVAPRDLWTGFTVTGESASSPEEFNTEGGFDYGYTFKCIGGTTFYPASGFIDGGNGTMFNVGTHGYVWSSAPLGATSRGACNFGFGFDWGHGYIAPCDGQYASYGLAVRCVKE